MNDSYSVLGVAPRATTEEIKKAYWKLAKETHPDNHPNDPASAEAFKKYSAAYRVICEERKQQVQPGFEGLPLEQLIRAIFSVNPRVASFIGREQGKTTYDLFLCGEGDVASAVMNVFFRDLK